MEAIFIYFVKVILISAVFWLYYLAFLRGKEFHHYNRFYLLITSVFSLALPVIKVDWFTIQANNEMLYNAIVLLNGDYGVEITQQTQLGFWEYVAIGVGVVSLVFILKFGYSVYKLRQIRNKYPKETHADYTLVLTDLEYAPFTFLKNLFWNNSIDFKTQNGSKILRHELTHIKEKHTLDRVYFQILKAIFWFNPIFYLFNREIALIHEYLADQKAIAKHDTKAFAEMLLSQHYTTMSLQGTSPLFSSTIKKRLEMLTKKHNTKFSYARRIWALPLLFALSFIYLVQAKNREIRIENEKIENETVKTVNDSLVKVKSTFQFSTDSLDNSKIKKVASFKVDSIKPIRANSPSISISNGKLKSKNIDWNKTLIYFNGKEVSKNLLVKKLAENPKAKVSLSVRKVLLSEKQKFQGKAFVVKINTPHSGVSLNSIKYIETEQKFKALLEKYRNKKGVVNVTNITKKDKKLLEFYIDELTEGDKKISASILKNVTYDSDNQLKDGDYTVKTTYIEDVTPPAPPTPPVPPAPPVPPSVNFSKNKLKLTYNPDAYYKLAYDGENGTISSNIDLNKIKIIIDGKNASRKELENLIARDNYHISMRTGKDLSIIEVNTQNIETPPTPPVLPVAPNPPTKESLTVDADGIKVDRTNGKVTYIYNPDSEHILSHNGNGKIETRFKNDEVTIYIDGKKSTRKELEALNAFDIKNISINAKENVKNGSERRKTIMRIRTK